MDFRSPAVVARRTRRRNVARSRGSAATAARPIATFQAASFADSVTSARRRLIATSYGDAVTAALRSIRAPSYGDGVTSATAQGGQPTYASGYRKRRLVVSPIVTGGPTLSGFVLPIEQSSDLALTYGARAVGNDGSLLATDVAGARAGYALLATWARSTRGRWYMHHDRPDSAEASTAATVWAGHAGMLRCGSAPADISGRRVATTAGGTASGSIGVWPCGVFDGVATINKLPGISAWNGATQFTISCLAQATAANPTAGLWVTATNPDAGSRLALRSANGKLIARVDTPAGTITVQSKTAVIDTNPHHLAVTWKATERPLIYVDGVLQETTDLNIAGLAGTSAVVAGDLWVGQSLDPGTNGRWVGKLGELTVALTARSADWLAALATAYVKAGQIYGVGADDTSLESTAAASPVAVPILLQAAVSSTVRASLSAAIENPAGGTVTLALVGSPSSGTATLTGGQLTVTTPASYVQITGQYRVTSSGGKVSTGFYVCNLPAAGWWNAIGLRKVYVNRRFRGGPDMWGSGSNKWNLSTGLNSLAEFASAQACPDPTTTNAGDWRHDWTHVCGGPIHKESLDDLDSLADHQTGQPYQGFLTTGSLKSAYTAIKSIGGGEENKLFWCPMLYAQPNKASLGYTETISGDERSQISIWELIAANGTVPGTTYKTDDVYWTLGRRCALAAIANGVDLSHMVIRWNKEGNRACPWGAPFDLDVASRFTSFVDAWARILAAFDRGFGQPALHFYGYARSGNTGTLCAPGGDPTLINRAGIWQAMECSWHPAKEVTQGGANAKINGESPADLKARVKTRYDEIIAGIGAGFAYSTFIDYCGNQRIPFICSESDPSKTTGSPCWVPDWAMEWLFDTVNGWQDALAAKGTCVMHGMFDTDNLNANFFWDADDQTKMKNAGCVSLGVPQWYPGYTTTKPIPAGNWTSISNEFKSRQALVPGIFKSKWGS